MDALLELGRHANQPLGIEYVDPDARQNPVSVDVPDGRLDKCLRSIPGGRNGYSWREDNGVVLVSQVGVPKGRANLINRTLPTFSIGRCAPQEAGHQLDMALTVQLHAGAGIAGEYNPGIGDGMVGALGLNHATVRHALDRIVAASGHFARVVQVPPSEMGQLPSSGLWLLVDYNDRLVMGRVGALIRHSR